MFGGGSDVKLVASADGAVRSCGGGWDTSMVGGCFACAFSAWLK